MSLNAVRYKKTTAFNALREAERAQEAEKEILSFLRQDDLVDFDGSLTFEGAQYVASFRNVFSIFSENAYEAFLKRLSRGARFMANQIRYRYKNYEPADLVNGSLLREWAAERELREWCRANPERARSMELSAGKFRYLGIRFAHEAERFAELYEQLHNPSRGWGSPYQPHQGKVKAIALTPKFNPLPLWVKLEMIKSDQYIHTDRTGNPWRFFECAKAWKWAPALPKKLAERVGKMPLRARMRAPLAWERLAPHNQGAAQEGTYYLSGTDEWVLRRDAENAFWQELSTLCSASLLQLLEELQNEGGRTMSPKMFRALVEHECALPHGTLEEVWPARGLPSAEEFSELLTRFGSPRLACQTLLGTAGKGTIKAFSKANMSALKWARGLAYGEPDLAQKILALGEDEILPFEGEVLPLMREWHPQTRLRMLKRLTYRYRGVDYPVSSDMVRDTGYLYNQIRNVPEVGRIRCWFTLHHLFEQRVVEEQPDEELSIPRGWKRIDGLCAIDGSWEIEFPKRAATLKMWGRQECLDNCIGGYANAIKSGRSVVFAIREAEKVTHAVEVAPPHNGKIREFESSRHAPPSPQIEEEVTNLLKQAGLIQ